MHRFIKYTTYAYYDSTTGLEYDERAIIESDDDWEAADTYLRIDTKAEFIKALKYLIEESDAYERLSVKIEDLIKLLRDKNLGDTFFERCVANMDWLDKHLEAEKSVASDTDFLITDKEDNILPVFKDPKEFQKLVLQHNIDQGWEYDPKWFDVDEKDLQAWRSEADYKKLTDTLESKKKTLQTYQTRVVRLQKEIADIETKLGKFSK